MPIKLPDKNGLAICPICYSRGVLSPLAVDNNNLEIYGTNCKHYADRATIRMFNIDLLDSTIWKERGE